MPVFNLSNFLKGPETKHSFSINEPDLVNYLTDGISGDYVSADVALKNSDIYSLISQLTGDLTLVKYQADTDRTQNLIDNPSRLTNGYSFWQSMFAQLLLDGNAYAYRWKNVNGVDLYWEYLRPSQVNPQMLEDGSGMVYNITFDEPSIGFMENVPAPDMIHIRLMSKNGGMTGISPLLALVNELKIKDASNRLSLHSLNQSVEAPGVLSVTGGGLLDWKKKSARSREFMRQVNNSDNGPIVLDDLETYQPLEVKSDVAKLLSQVDWTGKQIAKAYGVPDSYLNGQGDQQSSITQIGGQYAKALNRYVGSIVGELNDKLNVNINPDIRPAIDAMGDDFANTISNLTKSSVLSGNQALSVLQQTNYLPHDLPKADKQPVQVIQMKGDDTDNEENSN
ncbi:phage portal protein [Lactobacillus crispatus]|uniref:phage portal protein n=1 Tax=Lactobacillus crispatus TaxID=47770 RepID=UPI000760D368|nr:phage portal protein [Lactobacillus crispatus]KWU05924.1 portal protein [Lactobacillus crispatus]NJJ53471.1 phage portal protein [Lactobacillus crispatus]